MDGIQTNVTIVQIQRNLEDKFVGGESKESPNVASDHHLSYSHWANLKKSWQEACDGVLGRAASNKKEWLSKEPRIFFVYAEEMGKDRNLGNRS